MDENSFAYTPSAKNIPVPGKTITDWNTERKLSRTFTYTGSINDYKFMLCMMR